MHRRTKEGLVEASFAKRDQWDVAVCVEIGMGGLDNEELVATPDLVVVSQRPGRVEHLDECNVDLASIEPLCDKGRVVHANRQRDVGVGSTEPLCDFGQRGGCDLLVAAEPDLACDCAALQRIDGGVVRSDDLDGVSE